MRTHAETPWGAISSTDPDLTISERLYGFGGLHGGISLGVATHRLRAAIGDDTTSIRSIHARFVRPVRDALHVAEVRHVAGRLVDTASVVIESRDKPALTAEATFGRSAIPTTPFGPPMPDVDGPLAYDEFAMPVEFVPFAQFIEIRPTTADRPFAGGATPTLQAWIRLRDDAPVDLARLVVLFDALAPSAAASATQLLAIPTVELTVRPSAAVGAATSPWVLLDASSTLTPDGWVTETLDAWTPDGDHLGTATQLRLMTSL